MSGHVASTGDRRISYTVLVGKPEGRNPFERPRCRWKDNIKVDVQETGLRHGLD
jgi:hypothetical protein